ncbi:hypothetical protein Q73_02910 [Bacillus coahuilensis m2-6]|uniref:YhcU family protein n=1 Tax=Bacillus coahuilensis p1.1.43 TaxID=1150625 RepID=A0A147KB18_9BACI|nr:DUF5365 family protein [Bacillus coahuilensis]KUP08069.1 hypothetical protein Q75_03475 [Bacillus coahuilensis p1.1.43]KUP09578.1 hypothetical protein Q73_02910 [Bacillus coahuilensis m2-6]
MKVLIASTEEQEAEILDLLDYMYEEIFPQFFSDVEIEKFRGEHFLHMSREELSYYGTRKEYFMILSSLQTIISIIESKQKEKQYEYYRNLFLQNVGILEENGITCPFELDHFLIKNTDISRFGKAANVYLA